MTSKVMRVTPCFCKAEMFVTTRTHLESVEIPGLLDEKWMLLNKYPLPSVEENEKKLIDAAKRFGYKVFDSEYDRGLHGSLNNFFRNHPQPSGTIILQVDADSFGQSGYDQAIVDVMRADPSIAVCAVWNVGATLQNDSLQECYQEVAGYRVCYHPGIEMFNICGINLDWIMNAGGFNEPHNYYGGIEIDMYQKMMNTGMRLVYLRDYEDAQMPEEKPNFDPEYRQWKNAHLGGFTGSFGEWLANKNEISGE